MSVASLQATLEAHAELARRLNRQYELTSPAPVGVTVEGRLEHRDLRRLIVLASEPQLRKIFKAMSVADLQEIQSKLDDEEELYTEYELLGSQNYLRDLYRISELRARGTPEGTPEGMYSQSDLPEWAQGPFVLQPVVFDQRAIEAADVEPTLTEQQRVNYARTRALRALDIAMEMPTPPTPPAPPGNAVVEFGFSVADLGWRMDRLDRLDRATEINGEAPRVAGFLLAVDLLGVTSRMSTAFTRTYWWASEAEKERLRYEARTAAPLSAYEEMSPEDQRTHYYEFVWARKSRFYEILGEFLQFDHDFSRGDQAVVAIEYRRFQERQYERAERLLDGDGGVGTRLGQLLAIKATTRFDAYFGTS